MTGYSTPQGPDDGTRHPPPPETPPPYQPRHGAGPQPAYHGQPASEPPSATPGWTSNPYRDPPPPEPTQYEYASGGQRPQLMAPADPVTVTLPIRFAQLTYTHLDRQDGTPPGWKVKETEGQISAEEEKLLLSRVSTTEFPHLPPVLSESELAARPTQLIYASTPEGHAGWWHTIPAGHNSTGRPGNGFAHLILDRVPGEHEPAFRASNLIGWPRWLRPYGKDEVLAATLRGVPDPSQAEPGVDRDAAISFLVKAVTVFGLNNVLSAVLDAVAAAMAGSGPMVVLGVADPADAGRWVAGISQLMSPATSRRFFWSIGGPASGVQHLPGFGVHLAVLPLGEIAALPADPGILLIEESFRAIQLGALGEEHTVNRSGARVKVTAWSVLACEALQNLEVARRVLDRQDQIAAEIEDTEAVIGWSLAKATTEMADELRDSQGEAGLLLTENVPPRGLARSDRLSRDLRLIESSTAGASPQDALDELRDCGPHDPARRHNAVRKYVVRAMRSSAWLCRSEGVSLPDEAQRTEWDSDVKGVALDTVRAAETAAQQAALDPVEAVRLVDLLTGAGLVGDSSNEIDRRIKSLLDRTASTLLGGQGGGLVRAIDPVSDLTRQGFVRPSIDRVLTGPDQRIPAAVLDWIFQTPPSPPSSADLAQPGFVAEPTLVQVAVQATRIVPDSAGFRLLALWSAPDRGVDVAEEVRRFALVQSPWRADELNALLTKISLAELAPLLEPALRTLPDSDDLRALVRSILADTHFGQTSREVYPLARLRKLADEWWQDRTSEPAPELASQLLDHLDQLVQASPSLDLPPGVIESVVAARVVNVFLRPRPEPSRRTALMHWLEGASDRSGMVSSNVVRLLLKAMDMRRVQPDQLVLAAQLSFARKEGYDAGSKELAELGQVVAEPFDLRTAPVLDLVVWQWHQAAVDRCKTDLSQVQQSTWMRYRDEVRDRPDKMADYATYSGAWWRYVLSQEPEPATPDKPRWWRQIRFPKVFGGSE